MASGEFDSSGLYCMHVKPVATIILFKKASNHRCRCSILDWLTWASTFPQDNYQLLCLVKAWWSSWQTLTTKTLRVYGIKDWSMLVKQRLDKCWYANLHNTLREYGFTRSEYDRCMSMRKFGKTQSPMLQSMWMIYV